MKASEARSLMQQTANEADMKKYYVTIKEHAITGSSFVWWYKAIPIPEQLALEADGYLVENMTDRDGLLIKISWA